MSEKKPFESFIGQDESTRIMSALHHRISGSCSARRSTLQRKPIQGICLIPPGV
ncbi:MULTISPECIES: hypothetical protein [Cupriavidus]|uniref:hypothetical protein n=1 Tax=Cupriavidus sp. DF5525 TaxID=3160989 RepID=UPI0003B00422|nr:hypothetical protein N234_12595 [Ralstonia pickettii DTP0602]